LARERFDAFIVRKQSDTDIRQRRRWLATLALITWTASASKSFAAGAIAAFLATLRWTGRPAVAALVGPAGAFATAAFTGRTSAIAPRTAAVIATAVWAILAAFVFGVKICRSWFLGPCGQE
jgi:hypothetical protein